MSALKGTRKVTRFQAGATKVKLLVRGGRRVFPDKPVRELTALIPPPTGLKVDIQVRADLQTWKSIAFIPLDEQQRFVRTIVRQEPITPKK